MAIYAFLRSGHHWVVPRLVSNTWVLFLTTGTKCLTKATEGERFTVTDDWEDRVHEKGYGVVACEWQAAHILVDREAKSKMLGHRFLTPCVLFLHPSTSPQGTVLPIFKSSLSANALSDTLEDMCLAVWLKWQWKLTITSPLLFKLTPQHICINYDILPLASTYFLIQHAFSLMLRLSLNASEDVRKRESLYCS